MGKFGEINNKRKKRQKEIFTAQESLGSNRIVGFACNMDGEGCKLVTQKDIDKLLSKTTKKELLIKG